MEKIIAKASPAGFKKLFKTFFRPNLLYLCKDNVANFVIQRVIKHMTEEKYFKEIVQVIEPEFENMLCKLY